MLGCTHTHTHISATCRVTGQLSFSQGTYKMLQNCLKTSFSGSPSCSMFPCLFLSLFLSMSQSHPVPMLWRLPVPCPLWPRLSHTEPLPWHSSDLAPGKTLPHLLGFWLRFTCRSQEQDRKTRSVSPRGFLSHLDPTPALSRALPLSQQQGLHGDHSPAVRCQPCARGHTVPEAQLVLLAGQSSTWYPHSGRRNEGDTSPSPASCSRSPSPPVENRNAGLCPHGQSCPGTLWGRCPPLSHACPHCKPQLHPCRMNGGRAGP